MLNLLGKFLGQRDDQGERSPNNKQTNDVIESQPDLDDSGTKNVNIAGGSSDEVKGIELVNSEDMDDSVANNDVNIGESSDEVKGIESVQSEERELSNQENEQNYSVNQEQTAEQKRIAITGWRLPKLRAQLKMRNISFAPDDDKRTLVNLLIQNDPDLDGISEVSEATSALRTPEKKNNVRRYDLRSNSKQTRKSESPARNSAEDFVYPRLTRSTVNQHRRKSAAVKKSPKATTASSAITSTAPTVTPSLGKRSRKSESTASAVPSARKSRRKSNEEEDSVRESLPPVGEEIKASDMEHDVNYFPLEVEEQAHHQNDHTNLFQNLESDHGNHEIEAADEPVAMNESEHVVQESELGSFETQHAEESQESPKAIDSVPLIEEAQKGENREVLNQTEEKVPSVTTTSLRAFGNPSSLEGFTGSAGRGIIDQQDDSESLNEESDNDAAETGDDESNQFYDVEEERSNTHDSPSQNAEVVDLLDSESEREEDVEEITNAEEAVEDLMDVATENNFQRIETADSEPLPEEESIINSNPAAKEAMNAFAKLGSKFIVAISDEQQKDSLPTLSDKEYDLLKNLLEKMRPPAPIVAAVPEVSISPHTVAPQLASSQKEEISIQTDPEVQVSEQTLVDVPLKEELKPEPSSIFKEHDIFSKSSLSRKVHWNLPSRDLTSKFPESFETASTPQLHRNAASTLAANRQSTPFNYNYPSSSEKSDLGALSSSKKRGYDQIIDQEDDLNYDHARKRISFGGDQPLPSKSTDVSPTSASTGASFKFNLTQGNFFSSGAYVPKFRGSAVQFAGNSNKADLPSVYNSVANSKPDFVNRGLSFLEKRKLERHEKLVNAPLPAARSTESGFPVPATSNGVVAKEILKALSNIASPLEDYRKQPVPRLYPNDVFGSNGPKPNLFENNPAVMQKKSPEISQKADKVVSFALPTPVATEKSNHVKATPYPANGGPKFSFPDTNTKDSSDFFSASKTVATTPASLYTPNFNTTTKSDSGNFASPMEISFAQPQTPFSSVPTPPQQISEFTFEDPLVVADDANTLTFSKRADPSIKYLFSPPGKAQNSQRKRQREQQKEETKSVSTTSVVAASSSSTKTPTVVPDIWAKAASGVKCPSCMVRNDEKATKCVSCETDLKPKTTENKSSVASTSTSAPSTDIWAKFTSVDDVKCPSCMVRNKKGATKCVACEVPLTLESSSSTSAAVTQAPSSGFSNQSVAKPADFSKGFIFGGALPAANPTSISQPTSGGFGFVPAKSVGFAMKDSTESNKKDSDMEDKTSADIKISTSLTSTSFSFGGTLVEKRDNVPVAEPSLTPSLPFTPLHAKTNFPAKSNNDEEDEDSNRSKRSKRRMEDDQPTNLNESQKTSFTFGGVKTDKNGPTENSLAVTGSTGFVFGASTKEEREKPSDDRQTKPFVFGAIPTTTTKETSSLPKSDFSFSAGSTLSNPFKSTLEPELQKAPATSTTAAPAPFTFSAGTSTLPKIAESEVKPTTATSAPFVFGASKPSTDDAPLATSFVAGTAAPSTPFTTFKFGQNDTTATVAPSAGKTDLFSTSLSSTAPSESKPTSTASAAPPAPAFTFGAGTFKAQDSLSTNLGSNALSTPFSGKMTPPTITNSSTGNNNHSTAMESPNPMMEPSPIQTTGSSLAPAPFTFNAGTNNSNSLGSSTMFGSATTSTPALSTASNPFASSFNSTLAAPSSTLPGTNPPFGTMPFTAPSTTSNLFGAAPVANANPFGGATGVGSTPAFPAANKVTLPVNTTNPFGAAPVSATPGPFSAASAFPAAPAATNNPFGAAPSTGPFGTAANAMTTAPSNVFGGANSFGNPPASIANPASNPFGSAAPFSTTFNAGSVGASAFPNPFPASAPTPAFGAFPSSNAGPTVFGAGTDSNHSSSTNLQGLGAGGNTGGFNLGAADKNANTQGRRRLKVVSRKSS